MATSNRATPAQANVTGGDAPRPGMHLASSAPSPDAEPARPSRLLALDAFRGLTIVLMLLVNNVALGIFTPKQLQHAPWNAGVRLADFVMPWFLFCVGVAIPFAVASFRRKDLPTWRYDLRVITRAGILVLLGLLIDSSTYRKPLFTLGVLQIIGLAYLGGALLYELPLIRRLLIAAGMLVAYGTAILYLPIPGVGAGVLEESRNFIWHLNVTYFNAVHLWGLPSLVPTTALVMIGSAIGDLLRQRDNPWRTMTWLLLAGIGLISGGLLWSLSLPFSKSLWTPSYILLTTGVGTLLLSVFYLLLDARGWRAWAYPLLVFGANAILAYVAPILMKLWVLQTWHIESGDTALPVDQWLLHAATVHLGTIAGGWVYTIGYVLVWWGILWQFYRKQIFLRV